MNKSESITKLSAALVKAQGEMKNPPLDAVNPFFKSKYSPLSSVRNTVTPVLQKYGLAVIQLLGHADGGVTVETILTHESGEWLSGTLYLPAKNDAQGYGSAISYGRRYSLMAICGVVGDMDDDANEAVGNGSQAKTVPPAAKPTPKPAVKVIATEAHRTAMLKHLLNAGIASKEIQEYAVKSGIILSTETAEDWPLDKCPTSKEEMAELLKKVKGFVDNGDSIP